MSGLQKGCESDKQSMDEEQDKNYSKVAAKTVANIRRLQENVMSVNVTTSAATCSISPNEFALNDTSSKPDIMEPKQVNNISTISINKTNARSLPLSTEDSTSQSVIKTVPNLDAIINSPTNEVVSVKSPSSLNTNLVTANYSTYGNSNLASPDSSTVIQLQQDMVQYPISSNSSSPAQSPLKASTSFFSNASNHQSLQELKVEESSNTNCSLISSVNNELVTSPQEDSSSRIPDSSPQMMYSSRSNINDAVSGSNEASANSHSSMSPYGTTGRVINVATENRPTSNSINQHNSSSASAYSPKNSSAINSCHLNLPSSTAAQSSLPVISNELTSSFNALVTIDPNWQSTKNSIRERNAVMCNNAVMADVWFNVGSETLLQQIQQQQQFEFRNKQSSVSNDDASSPNLSNASLTLKTSDSHPAAALKSKSTMCRSASTVSSTTLSSALPRKIPGHKYVLSTGSTVFYAMFYGGLAMDIENGNSPDNAIEVPDVEPSAFLTMLKYLYCDEIDLSTDNVLPTLYAAKKYIIPYLAQECVTFLENSLSARNACLLLSQARFFDEPALTQRAWEVIDAQAQLALTSDGFVDIDKETLGLILARETLNCRETAIFKAALRWANAECVRRDIQNESGEEDRDGTDEQRRSEANKMSEAERCREALGDALYLVRFPCMTVQEFADTVAKSGILTLKETTDIFLYFTASSSQKPLTMQPFITIPRSGLARQICARFGSSQYRTNQWRYRGRTDSIQFCSDRRVFIVGFGLYGSSNGSSEYRAHIELKSSPSFTGFGRMSRVLAENTVKFFSDGSSNSFQVFFKQPVQIEPDFYYTASAVLDGAELSYFGQEGRSEVTVGRVTFQFQYSSESTNGTGVQGGQIPEIIFYGPTPGPKSSPSDTPIQQRHASQSDTNSSSNRAGANHPLDGANQFPNASLGTSSNVSRANSTGNNNNSTSSTSAPSKQTSKDTSKPKE